MSVLLCSVDLVPQTISIPAWEKSINSLQSYRNLESLQETELSAPECIKPMHVSSVHSYVRTLLFQAHDDTFQINVLIKVPEHF